MARRRRLSRNLIGLLIIIVALGVAVWMHDANKTKADVKSKHTHAVAVAAMPIAVKTQTLPPATQPISPMHELIPAIALSAPPTTAPAVSPPPVTTLAANFSTDAQTKQTSGDVLSARKILNDALLSGKLSPAEIDATKSKIAELNQTIIFSSKRFADDPYGGVYTVQSGDRLKTIAEKSDVTWEFLGRLNNLSDPKKLKAGAAIKLVKGPFNVIVTKSKFVMDIYLGPAGQPGSMYVTSFPVGLGRDDSTPTGTWLVETHKKIKNPTYYSPRGEGVIQAEDPKNPLGKRWVGLTGIDGHAMGAQSYGIHGNIDESSIGKQESMGCIRMHNADVDLVFDLMVEGKSTVQVNP